MQPNQWFLMQLNQVPNPTLTHYRSWFLMQPNQWFLMQLNQVPNPTLTQYRS